MHRAASEKDEGGSAAFFFSLNVVLLTFPLFTPAGFL